MPSSQTAGMSRRDRINPGVDGGLAAVHSGFDMQIGGVIRPYETTQFDVDSQQGAVAKPVMAGVHGNRPVWSTRRYRPGMLNLCHRDHHL